MIFIENVFVIVICFFVYFIAHFHLQIQFFLIVCVK